METEMIPSTLALDSPIIVDQLPVDLQQIISSYLGLKDTVNFYESCPRISPSVLSCCNTPTINDLQSIQDNAKMFECVLEYSRVTKQTLQNFLTEIATHTRIINKDVIKMLLKDPRIDPSEKKFVFKIASEFGNFELFEILLKDHGVDPSASNNKAIRSASANGRTKIVATLLQDGRVDPSVKGNEAIRSASRNGHFKIVEMLLKDHRVDPSDLTCDALDGACGNGHIKIVKLLLKDSRVDPHIWTIKSAIQNGQTEIVKILLKDGRFDPHSMDKNK
jgi:hypothetical protein